MNANIMNMFIQKFINRDRELKFLENSLRSKNANMIVIYGKRRVGKTELIKQFMTDKEGIYLLATQDTEKEQMRQFSEKLAESFNDTTLEINPLTKFHQIMEYLKDKVTDTTNPLIIAIDELPYLIEANKAIPSIIQKYWDEHLKKQKIFLILCGSSITMMENKVLGHKSPLYGRRTGQWKLNPLPFKHTKQFFPDYSFEDQVKAYSVLGGTPMYLLEFDKNLDVPQNITSNILTKGKLLYEEVEFLLKEELREPRIYFSILKALSFGKTKLIDISNFTGIERTTLTRYMETLETLEILEKNVPVTEKHPHKSRKTLYKIKDNFFRFWFRFTYPFKDYLERNSLKKPTDILKRDLNQFISFSFEDISLEFLIELNEANKLPFEFERIGRWWHKNNEIDLVALNEKTKNILFCEVKWQEKPTDVDVHRKLKEKSRLVDWNKKDRKEYFAIISKQFTSRLKKLAEKEEILLFNIKDIEKL